MKTRNMKNCKRPRTSQESKLHQIPTDDSEEEIQRTYEFMRKLKTLEDKRIFEHIVRATNSYGSGSLTYIELKNRFGCVLRNHRDLFEEFLSCFTSPARNSKSSNTDPNIARLTMFLDKVQALGGTVLHKGFMSVLGFHGNIEVMLEQLKEVFQDHGSLIKEFETYLIDSRLLKPKRDLEANNQNITENVTPSYRIRPEYVEGSSSDHEVLNHKYAVGEYNRERASEERVVKKRTRHWRDVKINNLDDKLLEEDRFLRGLASVIKFGKNDSCDKELSKKLPLGFKDVIDQFHQWKDVPQIFTTDPKNAVRGILPRLESMEKEMRKAKERRVRKIYDRVNAKDNVNK